MNTEIFPDDVKELLEKQKYSVLNPSDISDAVLYVLSTPPHVQVNQFIIWILALESIIKLAILVIFFQQVHELTIKPVGEPF